MTGPDVNGERAADRLMRSVNHRSRHVTPDLVAVVLHALADHTAIMSALSYQPGDGPWPEATSLARWFHDVADQLKDTGIAAGRDPSRCPRCGHGTNVPPSDVCRDCQVEIASGVAP